MLLSESMLIYRVDSVVCLCPALIMGSHIEYEDTNI
jgi:hypothetical protein